MLMEKFFPPVETALELQPEELAIPLLKCLIHEEQAGHDNNLLLHNFAGIPITEGYAGDKKEEILKAISEAWQWLEREGMIALRPMESGLIFVTKRGKELASYTDISKYISSNIIPRNMLDPILANKVLPLFIRGDYDTAVFQAFKEVEIRVRKAASLPQDLFGIDLMRKAFNADDGSLTDTSRPKAEREATAHLFAGAIGLFKNPSSHRDVNWENPGECAELIYLANHLIRMAEKHSGNIEGNNK